MANYWANDNGLWSNVTNWLTAVGESAGILPTSADDVYANNKIIYVDGDYHVNSIRNISAVDITKGGYFVANDGISLSAYVYGGGVSSVACLQFLSAAPASATLVGSLCAGDPSSIVQTPVAFLNDSNGEFTIIGNSDGGFNNSIAFNNTSFAIVINKGVLNLIGGYYRSDVRQTITNVFMVGIRNTGTLYLTGDVFGGGSGGSNGINNLGNLYMMGGVYGGSGGNGLGSRGIANSGFLNLSGYVRGGTSPTSDGILHSSSQLLSITGIAEGGNSTTMPAINVGSNSLYFQGTVMPGYITGVVGGMGISVSTGTVDISGTILGNGLLNGVTYPSAVSITGSGTVSITGNVISETSHGITNSSTGSVYLNGIAIGGLVAAVNNSGNGTVYLKRVRGGKGGAIDLNATRGVGLQSAQNSTSYVEEIEFGELGATPISGPVFLVNKRNTVLKMREGPLNFEEKVFFGNLNVDNLFPPASSVRDGVVYGNGDFTGTMIVPPKEAVQIGVPVGAPGEGGVADPRGTFILSPESFWSFSRSSSALNDPKSIGYRIKNLATIGSVGQTLASFNIYPPTSAWSNLNG